MKDEQSGAYLVSRNYRARRTTHYRNRRRPRRAAGVLIAVLLLLTAGICLLVVFLPRLSAVGAGGAVGFKGKTYYMLATAEVTDRTEALIAAQTAAERGGAGYIYNNGSYHIVAAAYEREADAKTLVSVNANSHYFALALPAAECGAGDRRALEYLTGEWFTTVDTAATELDRGNISDAAAERAVFDACMELSDRTYGADTKKLQRALASATEYSSPQSRSVLSYIRYVQTNVIVSAHNALK